METTENINRDILAITIAPPQISGTPIDQLNQLLPIIKLLRKCSKTFEIYPELTVNGSIHFHGSLEINDKIKWYKSILPQIKYKAYLVIKKNPDQGWVEYQAKDKLMMESILNISLPITYKHVLMTTKMSPMTVMCPVIQQDDILKKLSVFIL